MPLRLRGDAHVVDAVRALLEGSRDAEVLAFVEPLVARNAELEMLLAQMRMRGGNRSERIAQEQLHLFLNRKTPSEVR
jgi:hypothetical protein